MPKKPSIPKERYRMLLLLRRTTVELQRRAKHVANLPLPELLSLLAAIGKALKQIQELESQPTQPEPSAFGMFVRVPPGATRNDKRVAINQALGLPPGDGPPGDSSEG